MWGASEDKPLLKRLEGDEDACQPVEELASRMETRIPSSSASNPERLCLGPLQCSRSWILDIAHRTFDLLLQCPHLEGPLKALTWIHYSPNTFFPELYKLCWGPQGAAILLLWPLAECRPGNWDSKYLIQGHKGWGGAACRTRGSKPLTTHIHTGSVSHEASDSPSGI